MSEAHTIAASPGDRQPLDLHELLTVDDVAALLRVSKSWVYERTRARGAPRDQRLPHIRLGKYVRFEAAAVRAFLARKARSGQRRTSGEA